MYGNETQVRKFSYHIMGSYNNDSHVLYFIVKFDVDSVLDGERFISQRIQALQHENFHLYSVTAFYTVHKKPE
jgi:acyl-CoA thioesterase